MVVVFNNIVVSSYLHESLDPTQAILIQCATATEAAFHLTKLFDRAFASYTGKDGYYDFFRSVIFFAT